MLDRTQVDDSSDDREKTETQGGHQFLNTYLPNSVPVNTVDQLKKPERSDKLGE